MGIKEIAELIVGCAAAIAIIWRVLVWGHNLMEGQRCLLRSEMTRTYYRHREDKTIRQYEFENFKANFAAYKALHGNSFITKINDEIDEWEVVS